MLENLTEQPPDKILQIMGIFRADERADKIDLGVGVYRNADGVTPVMRAVKAAEERLWREQTTKAYTGLAGDPMYGEALSGLILGGSVDGSRIASAATPGGTGAVRQAFELLKMENPGATVWVSDPTWPNHVSILNHLGLKMASYRYFDDGTRAVDFAGMMADLENVMAGDIVLLHGCCHNPTGANLNIAEWKAVADHLVAVGATPMIDIAYQGFGDGLDEDAQGVRLIASACPETLIAASCSKNFGIYRERTGLLIGIAPSADCAGQAQATFNHLNRQNYSFPPDHGARLVTMILTDDALSADWAKELEDMRLGMLALREQLATELRQRAGSDRFGFIAQHRGMFSRLGASPEQVQRMRDENAVYMIGDSRLNIAGLNSSTVPILAQAIIEAGV